MTIHRDYQIAVAIVLETAKLLKRTDKTYAQQLFRDLERCMGKCRIANITEHQREIAANGLATMTAMNDELFDD